MSRTIVIGDVHGCYDELRALLDRVGPAADDRIIALGDQVGRGPASEKCLEFFRDTPGAVCLLGNHERKHIRVARGLVAPALAQILVRAQLGERYAGWLAFMQTFPRHIRLPEAILVHGFFEPGVPLEAQDDAVVIGTLRGEMYMREHYGVQWYEHYTGPPPLIVGHHSYLRTGRPIIRKGQFYAVDTGCAHGGRLTALVLPEFRTFSVPARCDYWAVARRQMPA